LNLNFLIKKKHIFKKRYHMPYKYILNNTITNGIYSRNRTKFELINLKVFKKIFSFKKKKKNLYKKKKYWMMIKPNFLLTMKSKNSRMGSGVGVYVRVVSLIKPNKPLILLKKYSIFFVRLVIKYLKLKLNINTYIIKNKLKL
jgi:hypothetical protein